MNVSHSDGFLLLVATFVANWNTPIVGNGCSFIIFDAMLLQPSRTRRRMKRKFLTNCGRKPVGLWLMHISMKKAWCVSSLTVSMNLFRSEWLGHCGFLHPTDNDVFVLIYFLCIIVKCRCPFSALSKIHRPLSCKPKRNTHPEKSKHR